MSLWLSAANRVASTGRGVAMAATRRQRAAATKRVTGFWSRAWRDAMTPRRSKDR